MSRFAFQCNYLKKQWGMLLDLLLQWKEHPVQKTSGKNRVGVFEAQQRNEYCWGLMQGLGGGQLLNFGKKNEGVEDFKQGNMIGWEGLGVGGVGRCLLDILMKSERELDRGLESREGLCLSQSGT